MSKSKRTIHDTLANKPVITPREESATIAERIERAKAARAHAQMVLVGPPKTNPNPKPRAGFGEGYFEGHYTGLTWRGKKIVIPKNKWGW